MGSLSIWHWLIVLVVVVLIFGTKKLRDVGQDLGGAVKGFKEGVKNNDDDAEAAKSAEAQRPGSDPGKTIEGEARRKRRRARRARSPPPRASRQAGRRASFPRRQKCSIVRPKTFGPAPRRRRRLRRPTSVPGILRSNVRYQFLQIVVIADRRADRRRPERLPKAARALGHLFGQLQRYVNDVKSDIDREIELDELRKMQQEVQSAARDIETSVSSAARDFEQTAQIGQQRAQPRSGRAAVAASSLPALQEPTTDGADAAAAMQQATRHGRRICRVREDLTRACLARHGRRQRNRAGNVRLASDRAAQPIAARDHRCAGAHDRARPVGEGDLRAARAPAALHACLPGATMIATDVTGTFLVR